MFNMVNGISLFSNVGIDELLLKKVGINIVGANELLKERASFYSHVFPTVEMVCGDINNKIVFEKMVSIYKKNNCNFVLATPPCQGMSVAGNMNESDPRNNLIISVIEFLKRVKPDNCLIENVPGIFKFFINVSGKKIKIIDYILSETKKLGYFVKYKILDAADYFTPQYRKRGIILISKFSSWEFPKKHKHITVRKAIGKLPSLESGESSKFKYHNAKTHNLNQVTWMKHTPTGKSAFDNKKYFPQKQNGERIKGFSTTYKRISWDSPSPTITMCNGAISSQNNVHPGRKLKNGIYSDARTLSIRELMLLSGIPLNWKIPKWATDNLIRCVIGECFPPKFCKAILECMPNKNE